MQYNLKMLKCDIFSEKHYLSKIISQDAMEELEYDFSCIIAKVNHAMPLTESEKEKVFYIYNRYHGTTKFVTTDQIVHELYKEAL